MKLSQFVKSLSGSRLMTSDEAKSFLNSLPEDQKPIDGEQLARALVQQKKLTAYQARKVYQGKGKDLVLGNYVILDKLGQGGMGVVLKAEHKRMRRLVALKVLSSSAMRSPDAIKRFHREVQAAAKLEHPNIVTAYDADESDGLHFLVMQYVEGNDLSVLVKKKGPLPVDKAVRFVLQAAQGLEYAHGKGVIHRDIKPANLLLDNQGAVKILDMGLARLESSTAGPEQAELTQSGQIMGTIDYMAPEQALSTKTASASADIYSLGITLWYLLTGRPAYHGESLMAKLLAHRESPIPSLQEAAPGVERSLAAIFARMVAKKPEQRYLSMSEVIAALENYQSESTVSSLSLPQASSEDSRLNAFLLGLKEEKTATVAPSKFVTVAEATINLGAVNQDTDPETYTKLEVDSARLRRKPRTSTAAVWWKDRRVLIGVAVGFVLLSMAAVVMRIATNRGEVIVKSFDPKLEITIRRNGRKIDEIEVQQLAKTTKYRTGDYEIEIKGGNPDSLEIKNNQFTLSRGQTVLVEITRTPEEENPWFPNRASEDSYTPGAADSNRAAAQWVLSIGGEITLKDENGKETSIRTAANLPEIKFAITEIELNLNPKVTDTGLANLVFLPSLIRLNLNTSTNISDAGLVHLQGLTSLKVLALYATKVTDTGLDHLTGLKQLELLILDNSKATSEGVAKLHKALPKCKITYGPTDESKMIGPDETTIADDPKRAVAEQRKEDGSR